MFKKRKQTDEHDETTSITVIKTGLNKIFRKNPEIVSKIQHDVVEISAMAREASLQIKYELFTQLEQGTYNGDKINFLHYFYNIKVGSKTKYSMTTEYENLRSSLGLRKYDGSHRSNLFINLSRQYNTIFCNNIWMHGYNRVRKHLYKVFPHLSKQEVYALLKYYFQQDTALTQSDRAILEPILLNDEYHLWPQSYFIDLCKKDAQFRYLYDFYNIYTENRARGWKNFKLIPVFRSGRIHVPYDNFAFWELLCSLKICPKGQDGRQAKNADIKMIDYMTLPKCRKSFHGSFMTDGVACSLRYSIITTTKISSPPNATTQTRKRKKCNPGNPPEAPPLPHEPVEMCADTTYIGIDPGMKLFCAGVAISSNDSRPRQIRLSSKQYHHECGKNERAQCLKKYTRQIEDKIEALRPPNQTWRESVVFDLQHMADKQRQYMKKKVARLKFDAYIRRQKTLDNFINSKLIGTAKNVTIFFGDAKQAANNPCKGYVRNPHSQLIKTLKQRTNVKLVMVDEYLTTKACSSCHTTDQHVVYSMVKHRFSSCTGCKIVWNRDINAANNILQIGLGRVDGYRKKKIYKNSKTYSI